MTSIRRTSSQQVEITNLMREKIRSGHMKAGEKLPSFSSMNAEHGIAIATIDRIYSSLEREGLIVRVQGKGTFVADINKAALKGAIALYAPGPNMQNAGSIYWSQLTNGIRDVLAQEGHLLTIIEELRPGIEDIADGLLCMTHKSLANILECVPASFPKVSVVLPKAGMTSVLSDDLDGVRQAVEYLLSLGHRRIAYLVENSDNPLTIQRLASYVDTMRRAGIDVPENWIRHGAENTEITNYLTWGQANMQQWLADDWSEIECTALVTQNDEMAVGAMQTLQSNGVKIPEQLSVVGFDSTLWCDFVSPTLTSVEIPLYKMGRIATETLMQQIRGEYPIENAEEIRLPTKLIVRDSTQPPERLVDEMRVKVPAEV